MSATMTMTKPQAMPSLAEEEEVPVETIVRGQFLAADLDESVQIREQAKAKPFHARIVWRNVALFVLLHSGALAGLWQLAVHAKWATFGWFMLLWVAGGMGITAGAHRLWAHRSYKARFPMRAFLMMLNCIAFQNDIIEWSRDHRCHHKWTDTDADPHNVNRGLFFSHMGWLLVRKHPQVKNRGAKLDLSDLFADPVLRFQRRFYLPLVLIFCFLVPTVVPVYFWGESAWIAFSTAALLRYTVTLHATWLINSVAHVFGYRPYDVTISPSESLWTTLLAVGEGGHNYHHTFPQDYRTSEMAAAFNLTKVFIDMFAMVGMAYERKTVPKESISRQMTRQLQQLDRDYSRQKANKAR